MLEITPAEPLVVPVGSGISARVIDFRLALGFEIEIVAGFALASFTGFEIEIVRICCFDLPI